MTPRIVVLTLPTWACVVLFVILLAYAIWEAFGIQGVRDTLDRHARTLPAHDEQLAELAYRVQGLADFLRVDFLPRVDDDTPGHEPEPEPDPEPVTVPDLPAQVPDTEPMRAVPTLVEDVALARALAEIENGFHDFQTDMAKWAAA